MLSAQDGEETQYFQFRDGDNYAILGRTSEERLLKLVGEFVTSKASSVPGSESFTP